MNQLLELDSAELVSHTSLHSTGAHTDQEKVLRWALFINSKPPEDDFKNNNMKFGSENGRRGLEFYGKPDLSGILNDEVAICPSKLLFVGKGESFLLSRERI